MYTDTELLEKVYGYVKDILSGNLFTSSRFRNFNQEFAKGKAMKSTQKQINGSRSCVGIERGGDYLEIDFR